MCALLLTIPMRLEGERVKFFGSTRETSPVPSYTPKISTISPVHETETPNGGERIPPTLLDGPGIFYGFLPLAD